ncbi:hypothetical protein BGZ70_002065 [Mortierella alpina]|uniref:BZIP domain-containing protein n=1 Tax=Mortierella alpina TaxID=64518 RepID=A0A9P6JBJ9_MORAP|nr:hypothetical protein BGZ70_002065 [Mortierella alpina]
MNMNMNNAAFGATERLIKSADALDFALTGQDKKNASLSRQGLLDFGSLDPVFGSTEISTSLFDDWLSGDLQQVGFMSQEDPSSSSDSDSSSHSPVLSAKSDSPVLGFDSIASDSDLQSSMNGRLFGAAANPGSATDNKSSAPANPLLPLTPEAVQQAAAALNIPWSKSLEQAVLAQSLLASLPMAIPTAAMALRQTTASTMMSLAPQMTPSQFTPASAVTAANMMLKHCASINVAHDHAMDISPPCTPLMPMSPMSPLSPNLPMQPLPSDRVHSRATTPLASRSSVLSSSQTHVPSASVSSSSVKATTYKSSYRSASLLKRDREVEEPPSVLDGKDINEMDEVSLKRAKNTDAARRSRHKKLVKMESLEQRVAELEVENSMFESKLNEVELERSLLADKDQMQQARIQELELLLASVREKLY